MKAALALLFLFTANINIYAQGQAYEAKLSPVRTETVPLPVFKLEALDGRTTLAACAKLFSSFIDPDFKNWGLDKFSRRSQATSLELTRVFSPDFEKLLAQTDSALDAQALTLSQVIRFCQKYTGWIKGERAFFFLLREGHQRFYAVAYEDRDGLNLLIRREAFAFMWYSKEFRYLVTQSRAQ